MAGKRWTQKWHQDQITSFKAQRTAYEVYALLLNKVLERVCRRHTQYGRAEARAKSVTSFAEKAIRKFDKYDDPIHMFTDLCGGRTVTFTQTEADRVCTFVRANFIVDEDNSEDVRKRLKPDQFVQVEVRPAVGQSLAHNLGVLSDKAPIEHVGPTPCRACRLRPR